MIDLRTINLNEHNQKRKLSKLELLKIRDQLEKKPNDSLRKRDPEKLLLLFKMAKKRQRRLFKKIGDREYTLTQKEDVNG